MPTPKQRKLAEKLLENNSLEKPRTKRELVKEVGYSDNIAKQPSRVLEGKGVKQALAEYGLTEELITTSLVSDIEEKPKNRVQELKLGAQILGMGETREKQGNTYNTQVNVYGDEKLRQLKEEYETKLRESL